MSEPGGPIAEYLAELGRSLEVSGRRRERILAEVGGHLSEAAESKVATGADRATAEREAVARFGASPALLAVLFGDGRRRRTRWWAAAAVAAALAAAGAGVFAYSASNGPAPRYRATATMVSIFPATYPQPRWVHSAIRDARRLLVARLVLSGRAPGIPRAPGVAIALPHFKPVSVPGLDAGELLRATRVTPSHQGNAIDFTVTSSDAATAERLATAWAATYLNWWRLGEIRKRAQFYRDARWALRTERGLTAGERADYIRMRRYYGRSLERAYTLASYRPADGAVQIPPA
jgi:HAAS domain-containing protein